MNKRLPAGAFYSLHLKQTLFNSYIMKLKRTIATLLSGALIFLVSCEYETIVPKVIELPDEPVSFAEQVLPALQSAGCATCHSGGVAPDLRADKAYTSLLNGGYLNVADPADSKLVKKINSGHATSGNLSGTDKALLIKWIEEGAKNN